MAVLAGIDEAGLGPKLGPLTLGLTVFDGPRATLARLAESLAPVVGPTTEAAVPIGDSKQLFGARRDVAVLERGVFAAWLQWNEAWPSDFLGWLDALDLHGDAVARTRAYPWYRAPLELPRAAEAAEVRAGARMLGGALAKRRVRLREMRAVALCAQEINDGIREHGTKNVFNFFAAAPFIEHVFEHYGCDDEVELVIDRQGGRKDYGPLLRRLLYPASVTARPVDEHSFGYDVWRGDRRMFVTFVTRADGQYLPVGLSSMLAKYTRELHMELFNAFWRGLAPDVRPTAGYPTDAARFLEDIRGVRDDVRVDAERLVRSR